MNDHSSNNPEYDLMVKRDVLEDKLKGLRQVFQQTKTKLKKLEAEAQEKYGTSDPQQLEKIAQEEEDTYRKWLAELEATIADNERLVDNVLNNVNAIREEGS